jgi:uncharacterized coiled-coil protein SlyX
METRLVDLEIRYAHLEKLHRELSDVLYEQRLVIDRLEARVKELEERMLGADPGIERPPHY